jgi:uncharacterized membrane protein
MNKVVLKSVLFLIMVAGLYTINILTFRSEYPMMFFGTLLASFVILAVFPYRTFFKR